MNMLDMHTREKVNKIHIAEMQKNARHWQLSRDLKPSGGSPIARGRIRLVLVVVFLVLLVGTLLISATASFDLADLGIMF